MKCPRPLAVGVVLNLAVGGAALAQPAAPGATAVPGNLNSRTWYPRNDVYLPEKIVGSWVFLRDGTTLEFLAVNKPPSTVTPKAALLGTIPAYKLNIKKADQAKAGIPGFASVELKDDEVQSMEIDDIATVDVGGGAAELFCRDWGILRNARDWRQGDEIRYITSALLSHVNWKIGKEHALSGQVGVGDYFSAGGSQYEQTATSGTVPAVAFTTTFKQITAADIAGTSCAAAAKPRLVADQVARPFKLIEAVRAPTE